MKVSPATLMDLELLWKYSKKFACSIAVCVLLANYQVYFIIIKIDHILLNNDRNISWIIQLHKNFDLNLTGCWRFSKLIKWAWIDKIEQMASIYSIGENRNCTFFPAFMWLTKLKNCELQWIFNFQNLKHQNCLKIYFIVIYEDFFFFVCKLISRGSYFTKYFLACAVAACRLLAKYRARFIHSQSH